MPEQYSQSLADYGNVGFEHGAFKSCLKAQVENYYSSLPNRQLPEDAGQTNLSEDARNRQGAVRDEGATHPACRIS